MIVLLFTFFIAAAYGQECKRNLPENMIADLTCGLAKEHIESFFKTSDPCVGMQLSDIDIDSAICNTWLSTMAGSSNTISIEKLDDLAHEIVRPSRFNKIYRNYLNRPELAKLLNDLSAHLKTRGLKFFNCRDLRAAANNNYLRAKENKTIGECYQILTSGGFKYIFGSVARDVSVSYEQQKQIESLFDSKVSALGLSDAEVGMKNRFTIDELKELKAIRKASELFERSTPLRNDEAGGFFSNLKGELYGGDQLNCFLEANSHLKFLRSLASKGLIQNFAIVGQITRFPELKNMKKDLSQGGHVAVLLISKKTGQKIVYDSWFEKGGEAAHILLPEEWRNLSLDFKNEFHDIVPLSAD